MEEVAGLQEESPPLERRLRLFALPCSLFLARFFVVHAPGLTRTFLSMWLHEGGHAVTAWLCGFSALPGPWRTSIAEERSYGLAFLFLGGLFYVGYKGFKEDRWPLWGAAAALGTLQLIGTVGLTSAHAKALILFGGDAGCFVLGTALMATFYADADSGLRKNGLRWGFLVIGSAGFMDATATWWGARHDADLIPFGENEGVGLSDPTRLVEQYGWTVQQLIHRYVAVCVLCAVVLLGLYLWGLLLTRANLSGTAERG